MACVVEDCKSHSTRKENTHENVSFHKFPKDEIMKNAWIRRLSRFNWTPTIHSRICSNHFASESFIMLNKSVRWRRLKANAVPILHLPDATNSMTAVPAPLNEEEAGDIELNNINPTPPVFHFEAPHLKSGTAILRPQEQVMTIMYRLPRLPIPQQQNYQHQNQWVPNGPRGFQPRHRPMMAQNYNEEYFCETCDRGFPNPDMLEKHKYQHQTCNIDGCQFIAHPKVITKHIQMQHSSGLFKKIAKLNNPEEIQKWIEERKKKYPTKLNVEKKTAEIKEKIERGEKMGLRQNRFNKNSRPGEHLKRNYPNRSDNRHNNKKIKENVNSRVIKKVPQRKYKEPPADDIRKLKPFAGIGDLIMDYDINDQMEQEHYNELIEDDDELQTPKNDNEPTICGALSSLICDYGSDEELDSTAQTTVDITLAMNYVKKVELEKKIHSQNKQSGKLDLQQQTITKSNVFRHKNQSDEDSGPEEVKVIKATNTDANITLEDTADKKAALDKNFRRKEHFNQHKKVANKRPKPRIPSTLLQKLLQNEIRQERNIVLQCIKHIAKNNYFDNCTLNK